MKDIEFWVPAIYFDKQDGVFLFFSSDDLKGREGLEPGHGETVAMPVPKKIYDYLLQHKGEEFWIRIESKRRSLKQNNLIQILVRKLCQKNGNQSDKAIDEMRENVKKQFGPRYSDGSIKPSSKYSSQEADEFINSLFAHCGDFGIDTRRLRVEWTSRKND
jgi:hypothetical protein